MNSPYRLIIYAAIFGVIVIGVVIIGFVSAPPQTAKPISVENSGSAIPATPPAPAKPYVAFTIVKEKKGGNLFYVTWQSLPNGTAELEIFRTATSSAPWTLWKTIPITPDELADGSWSVNIGNATYSGYSFYAQAIGTGGEPLGTDTSGTASETTSTLWTSSSTIPSVSDAPPSNPTSTDSNGPSGGTPPPDNGPTNTSTPTSTDNTGTPSSTPSSTQNSSNSSSSNNGTNGNGHSGIPYYTPQAQSFAYGNPPGTFWVQYVNNSIELGWQGLPENITSISVTRSSDQNGPWNPLMTQGDPAPSSTYSIGIIDSTYNVPNYYELTAFEGTTTIGTYGPVYLSPQ